MEPELICGTRDHETVRHDLGDQAQCKKSDGLGRLSHEPTGDIHEVGNVQPVIRTPCSRILNKGPLPGCLIGSAERRIRGDRGTRPPAGRGRNTE
jgi:hypothetical protein